MGTGSALTRVLGEGVSSLPTGTWTRGVRLSLATLRVLGEGVSSFPLQRRCSDGLEILLDEDFALMMLMLMMMMLMIMLLLIWGRDRRSTILATGKNC